VQLQTELFFHNCISPLASYLTGDKIAIVHITARRMIFNVTTPYFVDAIIDFSH
jgi:hypothetical protein